jgi:hypothetical protein
MIGIFMLALAALTSLAAYLLGVRRLGLEPRGSAPPSARCWRRWVRS